jgi:hypothetical protein
VVAAVVVGLEPRAQPHAGLVAHLHVVDAFAVAGPHVQAAAGHRLALGVGDTAAVVRRFAGHAVADVGAQRQLG